MFSIRSLFDATKDDFNKVPAKYQKRMAKKCKYIKGSNNILPVLRCPNVSSKEHLEDLESVKFYYTNPSLDSNFLHSSERSVEDCFKVFCEEMGINPDWKEISKILEDVDTIVLNLKFSHSRPRPKFYLQHESDIFNSIKDSKTPSYPSGHTTIAYFIASLLSDAYPEIRQDLEMMAELIGQSRVENGMHYPSDVTAGKMIGQMLSDYYNDNNISNYRFEKLKKSDHKNFASFLVKNSKDVKSDINELANFLKFSNKQEQLEIPFKECQNAAKKVFEGYPLEYVTDSESLKSLIGPLVYSYKIKNLNSPFKIISLHNQMFPSSLERGIPGEFRNFKHHSPSGHEYVDFADIYFELLHFCEINKTNPFLRHAYFEHIHPFCDGNGRIGRTILCKDLNYNFKNVNKLIQNDYIDKLNLYFEIINK